MNTELKFLDQLWQVSPLLATLFAFGLLLLLLHRTGLLSPKQEQEDPDIAKFKSDMSEIKEILKEIRSKVQDQEVQIGILNDRWNNR